MVLLKDLAILFSWAPDGPQAAPLPLLSLKAKNRVICDKGFHTWTAKQFVHF